MINMSFGRIRISLGATIDEAMVWFDDQAVGGITRFAVVLDASSGQQILTLHVDSRFHVPHRAFLSHAKDLGFRVILGEVCDDISISSKLIAESMPPAISAADMATLLEA